MAQHLQNQLEVLDREYRALASLIEDNYDKGIRIFQYRLVDEARELIAQDDDIDEREIHLEEECLKTLALYQPVAGDLRYIVSVLKINSDLERIGDLTANICSRTIRMSEFKANTLDEYLVRMADRVRSVLRGAVECTLKRDYETAVYVCRQDKEVDNLHSGIYTLAQEKMKSDPDNIPYYVNCISISRFLERIADHATNIAEDVYYMTQGKIIRHELQ